MTKFTNSFRRWHGSRALLFDVIEETTNLVEESHTSAANRAMRPFGLVGRLAAPAKAIHNIHAATATTVYESVRKTSRGVETLLHVGAEAVSDSMLAERLATEQPEQHTPQRSDAASLRSWRFDQAEAHLNGIYGDYLARQQNPLDLGMTLRQDGRIVTLDPASLAESYANATPKLCIFVHGLCCTEWMWSLAAEEFYGDPGTTFGSMLAHDHGYTPCYLRYNSGKHVSENGRALSALLTELLALFPIDVEEIVLVGHSMGGLVARSAAHYGCANDEAWLKKLTSVICIGAPNLGAPWEQAAGVLGGLLSSIDLLGTRIPARVLNTRSAGIKDLRHGYTLDEEWQGKSTDGWPSNHRKKTPMVDGVGYYFVASTSTGDPNHPVALLIGDLLVRLPSAKGEALRSERTVEFHAGRQLAGINHFHLASHPQVYSVIEEALKGDTLI